MSQLLSRLNDPQRQAVLHGNGPLLVLAGAGSGKTNTMAHRIAYLISHRHVPAANILGLSFTKKAAEELKERVKGLVAKVAGPQASRGITIATFHSLCVKIIRQNAERIGYPNDFTILDQSDQVDTVRGILRHIKVDDRRFDPMAILFEIGQAKNRFLSGSEAVEYFLGNKRLGSEYGEIIASVYPKYLEQLRALGAMDFDDLLFRCVELLEKNEDVRRAVNLKYRHILVDEYQDTNPAQFKLLRMMTEQQQNLCVVGDDDQSIYAWRGADSTHILEFARQFSNARVITLDQNYRSTSTILDAANDVIAKNRHRHPKRLWSDKGQGEPIQLVIAEEDRAEAKFVAEEILKLAQENIAGHVKQVRPWKDFAILYRSNPQSRLFEEALRLHMIPYKIVGSLSFLDRKEIKDLLSYWRLILNPKDDAAARRVANWPARGFGKSSLESLATHALSQGVSLLEAVDDAVRVAPRAAGAALVFRNTVRELRESLERTPLEPIALSNWALSSLEKIGVKKGLEDDSDKPEESQRKWDNLCELCNGFGQLNLDELREKLPKEDGTAQVHEATSVDALREYLARLLLDAMDEKEDQEKKDEKKDQVTLLTFHGAKGLEYPVVFMVGMEEGLLPHQKTIDEALDFSEERRLAYVGITRAKEKLFLTRTRHRIRYGKAVPRNPSRFIDEIPKHLFVTRDESYSPDPNSKESMQKHEERVTGFLDQIRGQLGANKPQRPGLR